MFLKKPYAFWYGVFYYYMDGFVDIEKRVRQFDVNKILEEVWKNPVVQKFITNLITEDQLYEQGEDGDGTFLGDYTDYSVILKLNGDGDKRIDHITLKDSGDFYRSVEVIANQKGFKTEANPIKDDGTNLYNRFGSNIIKLNEKNTKLLIDFIEPYFNMEAEKQLSRK